MTRPRSVENQAGALRGERGNRLLAALPARERQHLLNLFDVEHWEMKERLMQPGQRIDNVYLPVTAVVSLLTTVDDGGGEGAAVGSAAVMEPRPGRW
jgi:hypothetical protein